jgi:hypothetical protein
MPQVLDAIRRAFIPVLSQREAAARLMLQSPDGSAWQVTIDDTGALHTERVYGDTWP